MQPVCITKVCLAAPLVIFLGDPFDRDRSLLKDLDAARDMVCMAEVREEKSRVWGHKARFALFFAAMP